MGEDKFVAMCPFCEELLNQASDYIIQANERVKALHEEIRLTEIAEKQRLEDKADEREKNADDLAEKIRLTEIAEKQRLEVKAVVGFMLASHFPKLRRD